MLITNQALLQENVAFADIFWNDPLIWSILKGTVLQKTFVGFQRRKQPNHNNQTDKVYCFGAVFIFQNLKQSKRKGKRRDAGTERNWALSCALTCRSWSHDIIHGFSGLCSTLKVFRDVLLIDPLLLFNPTLNLQTNKTQKAISVMSIEVSETYYRSK